MSTIETQIVPLSPTSTTTSSASHQGWARTKLLIRKTIFSLVFIFTLILLSAYMYCRWQYEKYYKECSAYNLELTQQLTPKAVMDKNGKSIGSITGENVKDGVAFNSSSADDNFLWPLVAAEQADYFETDESVNLPMWMITVIKANFVDDVKRGGSGIAAQAAKNFLDNLPGQEKFDRSVVYTKTSRWEQIKNYKAFIDRKMLEFALGQRFLEHGGIEEGRWFTLRYLANTGYMGPGVNGLKAARNVICQGYNLEDTKSRIKCHALVVSVFNGFGNYYVKGGNIWVKNPDDPSTKIQIGPNAWNTYRTLVKRNSVLDRMVDMGLVTPEMAEEIKQEKDLPTPKWPDNNLEAPRTFLSLVKTELRTHGWSDEAMRALDIKTDFDPVLQKELFNVLKTGLEEVRNKVTTPEGFEIQGSITVTDHDGHVMGYVGRDDYQLGKEGKEVSYGQLNVPLGSLVKIILYLLALEKGWSPDDTLPNIPLPGKYQPKGSTHDGRSYTLRQLFAKSDNTAAVRLLYTLKKPKNYNNSGDPISLVKPEEITGNIQLFAEVLRKMGLVVPKNPGGSLALGVAEGDIYTIAKAVNVVNNQGIWKNQTPWTQLKHTCNKCIPEIPKLQDFQVASLKACETMQSMMRTVVESGTGKSLNSKEYEAMAKTGSAKSAALLVVNLPGMVIVIRIGYIATPQTNEKNADCYQKRSNSLCKGKQCKKECTLIRLPKFPLFGSQAAGPIGKALLDWMSGVSEYRPLIGSHDTERFNLETIPGVGNTEEEEEEEEPPTTPSRPGEKSRQGSLGLPGEITRDEVLRPIH